MCVLRGVFVGNVGVSDRRPVDELLATLGHELRGPLAPILNSLETLRLSGAFDHGHTTARACTVIEQQVYSLNRLINNLVELARLGRGDLQVNAEPIDITAVVRDAVEGSRPLIDSRRQALIVDVDTPRVWIAGDRLRLMEVFASILNSASKHTDRRGRIEVAVRRMEREAIVRVKNGIGIPSTLLAGIELTLARGIVAMHGGAIEASSDGSGEGSEFIVRLPRLGHWHGGIRS